MRTKAPRWKGRSCKCASVRRPSPRANRCASPHLRRRSASAKRLRAMVHGRHPPSRVQRLGLRGDRSRHHGTIWWLRSPLLSGAIPHRVAPMKHLTTLELLDQASRALEMEHPLFARSVCGLALRMADLTAVFDRADCPRCRDAAAHVVDGPADTAASAGHRTTRNPMAPTTIEGAEAAGRALGVSGRTVRRWLARCPLARWPSGSRPGERPPVWVDGAELQQWWAERRRWAVPLVSGATTTTTAIKCTRRSSRSEGRGRLRDRLRED